jgi:uncharacterized iron-regulated protein
MRPFSIRIATTLIAVLALLSASCSGSQDSAAVCGKPGQWLAPTTAESPVQSPPLAAAALLDRMAGRQVVLLGEAHDSAEDHRWQLHVLTQLYGRQPEMAIGFEMFPRRLQPVLDRWVAGALAEQEFLRQAEWEKVWAYDARDYLPLFHFARMNRIPMLALNVERSLPEAVGKEGWEAVPDARKEGVSRPAKPDPEYVKDLRMVFEHHPAKARGEAAFPRFVEAQTLWDRAMAQGVAEYLRKRPEAFVVGILGAGHVRFGRGVAYQLKDLGVQRVGQLLTWSQADSCSDMAPGLADAVYVVEQPKGNPPRLGVATEAEKNGGLRISGITAGSVAEKAGLKAGDIIVDIAGQPAKGLQMLRNAVQRQPPGTWLPLKIKRGDEEREILARFPVDP